MRALLQLGVILTTIHVFVSLEKLDCEENRARETSCGEPFLGVFGVPSLGSFISPRHVITSSQVIHVSEKGNDEPRWALGNKTWDYKCDITTGENFAKVPSEYVKDIEIVYGNCGSNFTCIKKAKPTEAYLLNWCSDIDYYNREDAPLVLAFSKELKHDKFFCMPAAKKNLENFQVDVYRLSDTKETSVLKQRLTKVI
uniref:Uncharacterized protein n=1 Tax=Caenorhabditis japonica TaxID=281687 RepID=A0A8R1I0K2_CAEJA